jgi:hypothetical protein
MKMQDACDEYLQLRLDTNSLASGIEISSGEGSGAEVWVAAADGVGGRDTCDQKAGEDGSGAGDGRHFCGGVRLVLGCLVGGLMSCGWVVCVSVLESGCKKRKQESGKGWEGID